ncbi:hypothetical protein WJX74_010236 [Apatococcus lobatus]|uniref:COX assembly mitochondrial protein n=2 Tax=Apatococcus TaxID=904362 RepID=A0AAW1SV60_9CHLO
MHPPLHLLTHGYCQETIEALSKCHRDHPIAKFWGTCNEQKWALDKCLREEKKIKRSANLVKARQEQERFKQRRAERE